MQESLKIGDAVLCLATQLCPTLCDPMDCSLSGSSVHGDSPGKNTGMGCHALLQGIFQTEGLNPDSPHCRWILNCLSHQGSRRTLEWVASSFSKGISWHRNQTRFSSIAYGFFTSWATRKAQMVLPKLEDFIIHYHWEKEKTFRAVWYLKKIISIINQVIVTVT